MESAPIEVGLKFGSGDLQFDQFTEFEEKVCDGDCEVALPVAGDEFVGFLELGGLWESGDFLAECAEVGDEIGAGLLIAGLGGFEHFKPSFGGSSFGVVGERGLGLIEKGTTGNEEGDENGEAFHGVGGLGWIRKVGGLLVGDFMRPGP